MSRVSLRYVDATTHEPIGARRSLEALRNGWLYSHETEKAKEMARVGTDEECERLLTELEDAVTFRANEWRMHQ